MKNLSTFSASTSVYSLAVSVLDQSLQQGLHIAAAESLTGGLLADAFVSVPGASRVFCGSAVTYDIHAKAKILGVNAHLLQTEGAVHPDVAMQMAVGAARVYRGGGWSYDASDGDASCFPIVGLSTTGVAGPGSDGNKPAGLVYVGLCLPSVSNFHSDLVRKARLELKCECVNNMWDYSDSNNIVLVFELRLSGGREEVRNATVYNLLTLLNNALSVAYGNNN